MFKSTFYKYITAFVAIILISFLMLSGIITSIINSYVNNDKREKLELSASIISNYLEINQVEQLDRYIGAGVASSLVSLVPVVNRDYDFNILITDADGKILLSTFRKTAEGLPVTLIDMGSVDISDFEVAVNDEGTSFLIYSGVLEGITEKNSSVVAKSIVTKDALRGYAFAIASDIRQDRLIEVMRSTVFNSSILVMLASILAAYFITERIMHPLRSMTGAARKFAKGDFRERVRVQGHDEVAELSIAFNNMAESLDNLEKMRNSFLANVSHDLRTPMTTISGFIEGITSGAIPPEQHNHYLNVISVEIHRLSRLVSQLLDLSRLESGDRKFNMTSFDIAEVARLIIISFENNIDTKRLDVEFETDEDSVFVYGDKDAIYQVFYNLCHNAIKFSKEKGRFAVKITKDQNKKVHVSIFDEGQVIPDEDALRIFDRFYKTDKSRGLDKNGVGLGLYICKTILDAHGENIELIRHDNGCEFTFTLKEGTPQFKGRAQE